MFFPADKNRIVPVDSFYVWRVLLKIFKLNDLLKKINFFLRRNSFELTQTVLKWNTLCTIVSETHLELGISIQTIINENKGD